MTLEALNILVAVALGFGFFALYCVLLKFEELDRRLRDLEGRGKDGR